MHRIPHTKRLPLPCRAWYRLRDRALKMITPPTMFLDVAEVAAGEEVAALKDVHAVPILWEQRVEIQTDKPFTLVRLHRLSLLGF